MRIRLNFFMFSLFRKSNQTQKLWDPARNGEAQSRLAEFARCAGIKGNCDERHYQDLMQWSVTEPEQFWSAVWDFCGVIGDKGTKVISEIPDVPWARFFEDSKISYAENMLAAAESK